MTRWEIRLVDRPSLLVYVDRTRDLAAEHATLVQTAMAAQARPWWQRFRSGGTDPYWQVTTEHRIHIQLIVGISVVTRAKRDRRVVIGFQPPDAGGKE